MNYFQKKSININVNMFPLYIGFNWRLHNVRAPAVTIANLYKVSNDKIEYLNK